MTLSADRSSSVEPLSSEDLRRLIESIDGHAFYMVDPQGIVVSWNRGAERITGYSTQDIIGQHIAVLHTPEGRALGLPELEMEEALQHGRSEREGERQRKDGSRFTAFVVTTPLYDEQRELRGYAKITRDITDWRRTEEKLRRTEERFAVLVDSVKDYAIYMLDPEGNITTWNAGAERIKGYKASEILGRNYSRFFREEDVAAGKPVRELELARTQGRFEEESFRVRRDGTVFWASVVLTPIYDEFDEFIGYAKVTRDLTERVQAEQLSRELLWEQAARSAAEAAEAQIREAAQRAKASAQAAEEANRVKDEFLATVSHELRTPLNAIVGWSALLQGRPMPPSTAKAIEVIHRNALAQAKLIDDILDVSRIITGKLRLELRLTDFAHVVHDAIEVVKPSAAAKKISIDYVFPDFETKLVADPERLQQVTWNLLSNAVKFSERGASIRASIEHVNSSFVLVVSDSGKGISPDFLPYVFDRFAQGDASSTRSVSGLGLGLAIVRHLVELHGGQVSVESQGIGHGATFRATLPIRATIPIEAQVEEELAQELEGAFDLKGARVLVVDDERDARELLQAILVGAGAHVETAASAKEGALAYRFFDPQLVVSDIGMPEEDGYTFMQTLKQQVSARGGLLAPAVALSAYTRNVDRERALKAGFVAHLGKPVDPSALLSTLSGLLKTSATG